MKRLFDYEKVETGESDWTKESCHLSVAVDKALEPIIDYYLEQGYPIREIEYIILSSASVLSARKAIDQRLKGVDKAAQKRKET